MDHRHTDQAERDAAFMRRAIALARTASGWTNPNPLVGAVIVRNGRVIGEGCHERYGEPHAERNALASCTEDPRGATMYVTLEPCAHTGKQPPCSTALINAGIARVVVGSADPNPLVAGRGIAELRAAGIDVRTGFLQAECDKLNPIFFHFITSHTPYTIAKWAMSADGKIATRTGDARWVSGEESRADVHELRQRVSALCVGVGTVLADDPLLTCRRAAPSRQPLRVVCDTHLRTPLTSALVRTADDAPVLIAGVCPPAGTPEEQRWNVNATALRKAGVEVAALPADGSGRVSICALQRELGARNIDSLLIEGGAQVLASAFSAHAVQEAVVYVAPKIVGGTGAPSPVGGDGAPCMSDAQALGSPLDVRQLGADVRITYRPPQQGAAAGAEAEAR